MPSRLRRPGASLLVALALAAMLGACSAPAIDVPAWRASQAVARPAAERGELQQELAALEETREAGNLETARLLALALATENPFDPRALLAASRAESDGVLLFPAADEDARNSAAASALDYAERAAAQGADSPAARAQLAWALGTTTHLQPMGERAAHAQRTLECARSALELEAEEPTALATLALVNLRLETLPWIARLMASGLPGSSLEDAERFARRAVAARPDRERRLILAKVLLAADREGEARDVLEQALAAGARFPRDQELEAALKALREAL